MTEEPEEREHITTGLDCWCKPRVDSYGAEDSDDEACWWGDDNGPCSEPAVTTYYDDFRRAWIPVCDSHRGGHYYARATGHGVADATPQDGRE
jgi:hypothetical protein